MHLFFTLWKFSLLLNFLYYKHFCAHFSCVLVCDCLPREKLLGLRVRTSSVFLYCQIALQIGCTHLNSQQQVIKVYFLCMLVKTCYFQTKCCQSLSVKFFLIVVLTCISLITIGVKHQSHFLSFELLVAIFCPLFKIISLPTSLHFPPFIFQPDLP